MKIPVFWDDTVCCVSCSPTFWRDVMSSSSEAHCRSNGPSAAVLSELPASWPFYCGSTRVTFHGCMVWFAGESSLYVVCHVHIQMFPSFRKPCCPVNISLMWMILWLSFKRYMVAEEFSNLNGWGFMNWFVTKWCSCEWSDLKIVLHDWVSKTCAIVAI